MRDAGARFCRLDWHGEWSRLVDRATFNSDGGRLLARLGQNTVTPSGQSVPKGLAATSDIGK